MVFSPSFLWLGAHNATAHCDMVSVCGCECIDGVDVVASVVVWFNVLWWWYGLVCVLVVRYSVVVV